MEQISKIKTEQRNSSTVDIDRAGSLEIVRLMNEEDKKVALAVEQVLPQIAEAVDVIYRQISGVGRRVRGVPATSATNSGKTTKP